MKTTRKGYIDDKGVGHIPLTQGKWALVDAHNFHWLSQWNWYATHDKPGKWYARTTVRAVNGKRTHQYMHRLIMGVTDPAIEVDHIDREATLDNRASNLRLTRKQNQHNRGVQKNNKSGAKGVSWEKARGKWRVGIAVNGKEKHLGYFDTVLEAAQAYNEAALIYHGEFAYQNDLSQIAESQLEAA